MNQTFRWVIVCLFAVLAFAGPLACTTVISRRITSRLTEPLRSQSFEGHTAEFTEMLLRPPRGPGQMLEKNRGLELSIEEMNQVLMCDLLYKFSWVWALAVIGISYGIFVVLGYLSPNASVKHSADTSLP